jgi:hypothetical protein
VTARERGFWIIEVPIEWHSRCESQLNLMRARISISRDLVRIRATVRSHEYSG